MKLDFKKASIIGVILSSALILSACNLYKGGQSSNQGQSADTSGETQTQDQNQATTGSTEAAATVTFSDSGVSPASVTIKSGEAITWVNNGASAVQLASDPHPTHTTNKEVSNGQFTLNISSGQSATVVMTKTGSWGYHDHANPSVKGTVIVE